MACSDIPPPTADYLAVVPEYLGGCRLTGVNVLLVDGSQRFVSDSIDGLVWRALGTVAGNEAL